MPLAVIVLAAGQGSRMNSDLPKVLHRLAGVPLITHVLAAARALEPDRVVVVTGYGADEVAAAARAADPEVLIARQAEQRGTGHAVLQAAPALDGFDGDVVVLYGDTPFVRPETVGAMLEARSRGAAVVALGFAASDPRDYGRLVVAPDGGLEAIAEAGEPGEADAGAPCNSGVIAAERAALMDLLADVRPDNAKGELYLTDVVRLARARGLAAAAVTCPEAEAHGVNTRADLAAAEAAFQARARAAAMENGVTLTDPATVWFAFDTVVGRDTRIGPNVVFRPGVTVESGAIIHEFCHFEACHIGGGAEVGPFARLRPGAELGADVKVGNFVEIKNAIVGDGAKMNHLAYVGDATVGPKVNVGAGAIVCNYDGVFKHRTEIGARTFVGSNVALVAPLRIGADAVVGAGSVITEDVPGGALALGRARQTTRPGLGARLMERLRALKAGKAAG
jgi:bifunctional UDP-N-acetylglucosamine pyrophosphorylase/glucosamine-1-phosphate N-acetyltransferase